LVFCCWGYLSVFLSVSFPRWGACSDGRFSLPLTFGMDRVAGLSNAHSHRGIAGTGDGITSILMDPRVVIGQRPAS